MTDLAPNLDLGGALPGPILFARFAFPPNSLGLCGPDTDGLLPERIRKGTVNDELIAACRGFEGAWPYLELIAAANDVPDPLDRRVVEAYWLGNALADRVAPRARHRDLERRFRPRTPAREWPWLENKVSGPSAVHHSFHVLEILPRIGTLRGGLPADLIGTMESCLVRPARVLRTDAAGFLVSARPLEVANGVLSFGSPREELITRAGAASFGDRVGAGDVVALHWDRICGVLTDAQARRLDAVTRRNLAVAVTTM